MLPSRTLHAVALLATALSLFQQPTVVVASGVVVDAPAQADLDLDALDDGHQQRRNLRKDRSSTTTQKCGPGKNKVPCPTPAPTPQPTPQPTISPRPTPVPTTAPPVSPTAPGAYSIDLRLSGVSRTSLYTTAKAKWEGIITGDLPDIGASGSDNCGAYPSVIDDLTICAQEIAMDGRGGILGSAGPRYVRTDSKLPITGMMQFDRDDAANFSDENWGNVIEHEMGHIIGIGSIWSIDGWETQIYTNNIYQGPQGLDVWQNDWGCVGTPPIELDGGSGTAGGHFDEVCFNNMLMTGWLNSGVSNPLSKLTVAALIDMGYQADMSQADPYTPPSSCCSSGGRVRSRHLNARDMGGRVDAPPGLSKKGTSKAVAYGRNKLKEAKLNGPKNRIEGEMMFVGDLFVSVLIEEDGHIYEVDVVGDE